MALKHPTPGFQLVIDITDALRRSYNSITPLLWVQLILALLIVVVSVPMMKSRARKERITRVEGHQ